jgi:hypothetical protein
VNGLRNMKSIAETMRQKLTEISNILGGLFNMTWKLLFGLALIPFIGIVFLCVYIYELAKNEANSNR